MTVQECHIRKPIQPLDIGENCPLEFQLAKIFVTGTVYYVIFATPRHLCVRELSMIHVPSGGRTMDKKILVVSMIILSLLLAGCLSRVPTLTEALQNRDFATAKKLIAKGADVHAKDEDGNTPLAYAAWVNSTEIVTLLISKGADVNAKDEYGRTPLHKTALNNSTEVAALLISKGADVNAKNKYGTTPLHKAARLNSTEVATLLISKGADVNAKDRFGRTPLDIAQDNHHTKFIAAALPGELLKSEKIKTTTLIARGSVNERDTDTNTALHRTAALNGQAQIEQLIVAGAKINIVNKKGDTPLHFAARTHSGDAVDALLRAGGNPYKVNVSGESALSIAVESGDEDLIGAFVLAGIDVSAIANLTQEKAQREWEAEQEQKRQAEAKRLAKKAEIEAAIAARNARDAHTLQTVTTLTQITLGAQAQRNAADAAAAATRQAAATERLAAAAERQPVATAGGNQSGDANRCVQVTQRDGQREWVNNCNELITVALCVVGQCGSIGTYYNGGKFHLSGRQRYSTSADTTIQYRACFGYANPGKNGCN